MEQVPRVLLSGILLRPNDDRSLPEIQASLLRAQVVPVHRFGAALARPNAPASEVGLTHPERELVPSLPEVEQRSLVERVHPSVELDPFVIPNPTNISLLHTLQTPEAHRERLVTTQGDREVHEHLLGPSLHILEKNVLLLHQENGSYRRNLLVHGL